MFAVETDTFPKETVQAFGLRYRQRAEEQRVDEAESRRAGADRQSERQDRGGGSDFPLPELPPAEDGVGAEGIEPADEPDVEARFTMPQGGTERPADFGGIATLFDCFRDVRLQLFVDLDAQTGAAE